MPKGIYKRILPSPLKGKKRPPMSLQWRKNLSEGNKRRYANTDVARRISNKLKGISTREWSVRGEKHSNWKGGITPLLTQIRTCLEYNDWRLKVFTRDSFTCVECSNSGIKLNADHIKPFSFIVRKNSIQSLREAINCEELWDIKNGRTLCVDCHRKTDTFAGKAVKYQEKLQVAFKRQVLDKTNAQLLSKA